ncbi:MAG: tol-pal system protein YbgF [Pseudomonadota bacterium]|nr:tol-pal system protein YbgF [Pseudomonadota bacterium]
MMQRLFVILVCGCLCFCASCKMPLDERPEVEKLRNKVSTLEQQVQDQEVKQKGLEIQLQDLQLKVDGIRDLALKNSQHLVRSAVEAAEKKQKVKSSTVTPAKKAVVGGKSKTVSADKAMMTYQQAFGYYKNGNFEKSIDLFHAFIRAYPKHEMVSNARYWLGEDYYSLSEFAQAITEFKRVLADYPKSKKVPGSLLKVGMSYQAIGFDGKAKGFYQKLVEQFPDSNSAAIAKDKLKEL